MTNLNEIIQKILLIDEVSNDLKKSDIEEWDSMTHLVLISEIEQNYEITLEDEDIAVIESIEDLKTILSKYNVTE